MLGLICIDVDGTLVGSSNEVRPEVWAAAERARAAGVRLAVCTGRPAFGKARGYAERLDRDGWHVFQNGASIVRTSDGDSLSASFPDADRQRLSQQARDTGRILEVYTDSDYAVESRQPWAREHAEMLGVPFDPRDPAELRGEVIRLQWLVHMNETNTVLGEPHAGLTLHPATSPGMPETMFISVTKQGVDKGAAIRQVAQKYGLGLDRVMMVGDGHNDVLAMNVVGHPVAMGNADDQARAAARYVVGSVNDGGLAEAIEMAMRL